jgi:ketosteroid isomerase-like protein
MADPTLEARLDRVEAELAIRQLAARYALAVDARDLDGLVLLFADDVDCGRHGCGRAVLHTFFADALRGFYRSAHLVCGHVIELSADPERATGVVSCRAEHEVGERWVVQTFCYFDDYERRDGTWCFRRRRTRTWYTADVDERPAGPAFSTWDGALPGRLPETFPTWAPFWAEHDPGAVTEFPVGG